MSTDKISERHLDRTAMIYIRQSTLQQVKNNTESTRRQYALADRARHLGFKQVEVIDEDLGVSGSGHSERRGFKRLIAAVCCGEVGAVFALEASRLARNNRDWHHLLELCMLSESLVIDDDGVYDPRVLNDRLLLGLKGTMSEFELGILRQRAQEAYRGKVARGEVLTRVPVGYVRDGSHGIAMTPDRRVQEAIRGLFELLARLGTLRQALLWYHQQGVRFPVRRGSGEDERIEWRMPNYQLLLRLIKNPVFAGAFAYGRTCSRSRIVEGRASKSGGHKVAMDKWEVLIKDHHAAYITWEQYMQNQRTLTQNSTRSHQTSAGAPREGNALLGGLLRCGKCGHKLQVRYRGAGQGIRYSCTHGLREQGKPRCIQFGGFRVDEKIAGEVLAACRPLAIEASLQASEQRHGDLCRKKQALEMTLKNAQYEAGRARRQYDAVDPENRLVSAELEKRWNEALQRVGEAEERLKQEEAPRAAVSDGQKQRLMQLGENLERVWHDPRAPVELKKRIIRSLIHEVIVTPDEAKGIIELNIHWAGGVHTRCGVTKNKAGRNNCATGKNVVEIVRVYAQAWSDAYIASMLNRMGLDTGAGNSWNETRVKNLRLYNQIPVCGKGGERSWLTMSETAGQLHVSVCVINTMVKHRLLPARQLVKGAPWLIEAADLDLPAVRNYIQARLAGKKAPQEDTSQILIPCL